MTQYEFDCTIHLNIEVQYLKGVGEVLGVLGLTEDQRAILAHLIQLSEQG